MVFGRAGSHGKLARDHKKYSQVDNSGFIIQAFHRPYIEETDLWRAGEYLGPKMQNMATEQPRGQNGWSTGLV